MAAVVICLVGLYLYRAFQCGSTLETTTVAAPEVQRLVLQRVLDRSLICTCAEIRVGYTVRLLNGSVATHIAHYDAGEKTFRIETDPGSGWAFGWDDVNGQVVRQVLAGDGQFSTFTRFRPGGRHVPRGVPESY